jgi:hypothetical protein
MVTKAVVLAWAVGLLTTMQPPKRLQNSYIKEAHESIAQTEDRYAEIAEAYLAVAFDEKEKPVFGGQQGRLRTATLELAVAYFESGFRRDVHLGQGKWSRGDGGRSWCLQQINIGAGKCARAGLHIMRRAISACAALPWVDRLSAYVSGSCVPGQIKARARMRYGMRKFDENKPSFTDAEVTEALALKP